MGKRGQKECPKCKTITGPRSLKCKKCEHLFHIQKSKVQKSNVDWRDLVKGDIIKVLQGSGPYWTTKEGEKEYMGHTGQYKVCGIIHNGINAYQWARELHEYSGHDFIYMGDECVVGGMTRRPHKIVKIKRRK